MTTTATAPTVGRELLADTLHLDGPPHRHRDGDNLWYIHPLTEERFLSVTSVLDFAHKDALANRWKPGLAAKKAIADLPRLIRATRLAPCGRTNSRCYYAPNGHDKKVRCAECPCGECTPCLVLELTHTHFRETARARDRGSDMHTGINFWVLHGRLPQEGEVPRKSEEDVTPYLRSFLRFVEDAGLTPDSWEMAEATLLNRADRWAGTADGDARFDATKGGLALKICKKFGLAQPLLRIDTKSRETEDSSFFAEMALQLTAYLRGEAVLLPDGREVPANTADGGLVVQIHPDGYHWRRVLTRDEEYQGFLGLLRFAYWSIENATRATQVKTFPDLDIPGLELPKKRARKATAAATTGETPAKKATKKAAPRKAPTKKAAARAAAVDVAGELVDAPLPGMPPARTPHPAAVRALGGSRYDVIPDDAIPF